MRKGWAAAVVATALVAACSREAPAPGALSADDEQRLNEAAAMLDANAVDVDTTTANAAGAGQDDGGT